MARYTGPVCRLCRRERMKLYLKGTKCDSMKCPIERRPYPPGDHGRSRRQQGSEYLTQLRETELWLAPIAGTRLMVPYRVTMPTPFGQGVLDATHFVTVPQTARATPTSARSQ